MKAFVCFFQDNSLDQARRENSIKSRKPTLEDQLAVLSAQHNIYPAELFKALTEAKEQGKSEVIEDLTVDYRGSVNNEAIFLITKNNKVVAQFRVPEETLSRKDVSFDNWMDASRVRKEIAKRNPAPSHVKVEDLRVGMKKINLIAEVLETSQPSKVHTQFRDNALVSNALIGDDTGKIMLCLWDAQVNAVSVGDCVEVKNAHVATFKGDKQLRLGKNGSVKVVEKPVPSETA